MKTQTRSNGEISVTLELGDRQCTVNTGATTAAEAKAIIKAANLESVESLAKAGQLTAALIRKLTLGGTMRVTDAIEHWRQWSRATANSDLTSEAYQRYVDSWYTMQAPERLMDVNEEQLSTWLNQDDGSKASTKRIRLAALRSFFGYCSAKDYLSPDPSLTVRIRMKDLTHEQKEPRKRGIFTDAEFQKLVDHIMGKICAIFATRKAPVRLTRKLPRLWFWYTAVLIGRHSGLRLGDICSLQWSCFSDTEITVWTDKRDKRVVVQITELLRDALRYIPSSGGPYCFPREHKMSCDPKQRHKLCVEFAHILEQAKLPGHSFHEFRHTRATELYQQGKTLEQIAELMGHSSIDVTKGYVHADAKLAGPATP